MRRLANAIVFVLSLCGALAPIAAFGTVMLTTGPDYPPFTDQNARMGGVAVQIVQAVFQRLGESTRLTWLPWKRGYALTLAGRFDATFPYIRSPERERDFLYSDPIITAANFLYTRPGEHLDLNTPATFMARTICVPQGYYSPLEAKLHGEIERGDVMLERAPDMDSCVRMLAAGRVDALTAIDIQVRAIEKQTGGAAEIEQSGQPYGVVDFMLIAPRSEPGAQDLIRRFNAGLQQIKADGSYRNLLSE